MDTEDLIQRSRNQRTRLSALNRMQRTITPEVTARLVEMQSKPLSSSQLDALVVALGKHGVRESRDFIVEQLASKDAELVQGALLALRDIFGSEATDIFAEVLLTKRSEVVRMEVMAIIREHADHRAVEAVKRRLKSVLGRNRTLYVHHEGDLPTEVLNGLAYLGRMSEEDPSLRDFIESLSKKRWDRLTPEEQRWISTWSR